VSFLFGRPLGVITMQTTATDKFTQELRLASSGDSAFEWLAGVFYTREKSKIDPQDFFAVEAGTDTIAEDIPQLVEIFLRSNYEEYAAFGNVTWSMTDRFDLTLGGRASRNEQDASQFLDGSALGIPPTTFQDANSSEDVFTWSIAPRVELSDDTAAYARIATGYRPGGPNVLPPDAPPGTPESYDSDTLTSYEIGLKADWLDDRLLLDLAAFYLDWDDIQLLAIVNDVGINANGGTAVSRGFEFAATVIPVDNLTVSLNGAWTDAELTQDTDPVVGGLDGDSLPWVPEWSSSVAVDYEWAARGDVTAWVGGNVSYVGERTDDFSDRDDVTGEIREAASYTTVDLRAGFDTGRWSFEVYARNLTDERGITSLSGFDPTTSAAGAAEIGIIRPRVIGLSVGVEVQ
jgi:outer membrane receptor protein involved in Fe transport